MNANGGADAGHKRRLENRLMVRRRERSRPAWPGSSKNFRVSVKVKINIAARLRASRQYHGKDGRPEPIIAKVSQETLAEMIGTTRSRVSFFMNKFRKLGLIDYNGQIEIHSSLLNVVLHEEPHINS
jgi:CRP-like cAMP-binding protein